MNLMFVNPISNQEENINLECLIVTYNEWKVYCQFDNDKKICDKLDSILSITSEGYINYNIHFTNTIIYKTNIKEYYYFLLKLNNYLLYNKYLDKLINYHINNLIIEWENPIIQKAPKKKHTKKIPNKFIKMETKDLFSNKTKYIYTNPKTKEEICSDNPNLLEELNVKKKKVKRTKAVSVGKLVFNFNIKKK